MLSAGSFLFHHASILGAGGLGEDGESLVADVSGDPQYARVIRWRRLSLAVFVVSGPSAWVAWTQPWLVQKVLHLVF